MLVQVTFGLECHPTGIASKGPLVGMPPDMLLKYRWFVAVQPTVRTHILSGDGGPASASTTTARYHRW